MVKLIENKKEVSFEDYEKHEENMKSLYIKLNDLFPVVKETMLLSEFHDIEIGECFINVYSSCKELFQLLEIYGYNNK